MSALEEPGIIELMNKPWLARASKIGFTGTRHGMTSAQREKFRALIVELAPEEFHHGDCIGADAEAHDDVRALLSVCRIVIHPPADNTHRGGTWYTINYAMRSAQKCVYVIGPSGEYVTR